MSIFKLLEVGLGCSLAEMYTVQLRFLSVINTHTHTHIYIYIYKTKKLRGP
jgi:hypothetical protein